MLTVKEVLDGKIGLDLRCVDRVLLNGWVRYLQMPGGVVNFIREQQGWPIPSPAAMTKMRDAFRKAVEQFALQQGLKIVTFVKGESKEELAHAEVARCSKKSGVAPLGKSQEQAIAFKGRRDDQGSKVWFSYSRQSVNVTHYYFYVLDEDFGLAFIKVCTYLPFEVKVCFNGHEWAKQQMRKAGITFEALDNGFAECADPAYLQARCHQRTGDKGQAFFDRWVDQLPWPLTPMERAAGYQHELSVWRREVSRTQVFLDAEQGRALVENLIGDNLDLGRPDRVRLVFDRRLTKRTLSEFSTAVITSGVMPSIRIHYKHSALTQYLKEGRALRTEMMINNPRDFDSPRGIAHFDALVALGQSCNDRLLEQEKVSQDCFVPLEQVRELGQSTVDAQGQRAPALRFGDQRVMAVLAALAGFGHIPGRLSHKHLRQPVSELLGATARRYTGAQMSYDLRRLRLKGLVECVPKSHAYIRTELGAKVAVFFTKLHARLFRPGLAAIATPPPAPSPLAQALTNVSELIEAAVQQARFAPSAPS